MAALVRRAASIVPWLVLSACGSRHPSASEGTGSASPALPGPEAEPGLAVSREPPPAAPSACSGADCPCVGGDCNRDPIGLAPAPAPDPGLTATCEAGSTETAWAQSCQSALSPSCVPGTWQSWGS